MNSNIFWKLQIIKKKDKISKSFWKDDFADIFRQLLAFAFWNKKISIGLAIINVNLDRQKIKFNFNCNFEILLKKSHLSNNNFDKIYSYKSCVIVLNKLSTLRR